MSWPARRLRVHAGGLGGRLGSQGAGGRRPEGAGRRDRRARGAARAGRRRAVPCRRWRRPLVGQAVGKLSPARRVFRATAIIADRRSPAHRARSRRPSRPRSRRMWKSSWDLCSSSPPARKSPALPAGSHSSWSRAGGARSPQGRRGGQGLDQPARATLRKFGVRFGAYNIYIPPLLAGAARARLQLWALKRGSARPRKPVGRLAASGRTSIAAKRRSITRSMRSPDTGMRRAGRARRHAGAIGRHHPAGADLARGPARPAAAFATERAASAWWSG